jgi:hypothetical protein
MRLLLLRWNDGDCVIVQAEDEKHATDNIQSAQWRVAVEGVVPPPSGSAVIPKQRHFRSIHELTHFMCVGTLTDYGNISIFLEGLDCVAEILHTYPQLESAINADDPDVSDREQEEATSRVVCAVLAERGKPAGEC